MSEVSEKLKEIAKRSFDLKGFKDGIIDEVLEPSLQEIVDDSSNPYDNMIMATLYPQLEEKLKEKLDELIDKLYA